jgi:hypothetical protein
MAYQSAPSSARVVPLDVVSADSRTVSAVSWAAVFAGALGAVAISIILVELGLGLGFSSTSAWPNSGATLGTLGVMGGVWLILTQWIASGVGGYVAGRLRTKRTGIHTDEVFFRDTVHGFLAWSLGTVIGVALIAMGSATVINATSRVAGGAAQGAAATGTAAVVNQSGQQVGQQAQPIGDRYYVDMLFRPVAPNAATNAATAGGATAGAPAAAATSTTTTASQGNGGEDRAIVTRIFTRDLASGNLAPDDRTYVAQIVARRDGISQAEAEQRVDQTVTQVKAAEDQARQAADKARKTAAFGGIVTALAMLVGAFIAAVSGAYGGKLRDEY